LWVVIKGLYTALKRAGYYKKLHPRDDGIRLTGYDVIIKGKSPFTIISAYEVEVSGYRRDVGHKILTIAQYNCIVNGYR